METKILRLRFIDQFNSGKEFKYKGKYYRLKNGFLELNTHYDPTQIKESPKEYKEQFYNIYCEVTRITKYGFDAKTLFFDRVVVNIILFDECEFITE